jgi:hypothetical protein
MGMGSKPSFYIGDNLLEQRKTHGGKAIAAYFVPRKTAAVKYQVPYAKLRQKQRCRSARRASTSHYYIKIVHGVCLLRAKIGRSRLSFLIILRMFYLKDTTLVV